jgi:hypothetical protein
VIRHVHTADRTGERRGTLAFAALSRVIAKAMDVAASDGPKGRGGVYDGRRTNTVPRSWRGIRSTGLRQLAPILNPCNRFACSISRALCIMLHVLAHYSMVKPHSSSPPL